VSGPPQKRDELREEPTVIGDASVVASVHKQQKPFLLQQIGGPGAPRDFTLELEETVIGRSLQAHLSIDSSLLSRRHMAIKRIGLEYKALDLDSANGMYLNGVKAHSALLRGGDTIQIGDVVLVFREGG
jgi:pSer/pThr/pTyr-binding forkhead associated (FHA) protein